MPISARMHREHMRRATLDRVGANDAAGPAAGDSVCVCALKCVPSGWRVDALVLPARPNNERDARVRRVHPSFFVQAQ